MAEKQSQSDLDDQNNEGSTSITDATADDVAASENNAPGADAVVTLSSGEQNNELSENPTDSNPLPKDDSQSHEEGTERAVTDQHEHTQQQQENSIEESGDKKPDLIPEPSAPVESDQQSSNSGAPDVINKAGNSSSEANSETSANQAGASSPAQPPSSTSNEKTEDQEQSDIPKPEVAASKTAEEASVSPSVEAVCEGATASASSPTAEDKAPLQSVYHVKWVKYKNNSHAIITQNENGPCPLLAIMNVLLLQGRVKLPAMMEMVTSGQLMEYLGDCIFEHAPKNITEDAQLNYEQNMHDAMAVFHKLQTGLDVNVKFTGVADFEYTPECIVFDLLDIPLYHGWLVDPQHLPQVTAIGNCSYNQLVEKVITQKLSTHQEKVTEALIAEDFLQGSASQLTYHGLSELASMIKDNQLCVFFRNNHFSTLHKHKDELFLLVTDQGFLTESNMVWETLSNVEGDGHFVDAQFHTFRKPEPSSSPISHDPSVPIGSDQQIDHDFMVALSLQEAANQEFSGSSEPPASSPLSDHELAMQLQEEENQRAAAAAATAQQGAAPAGGGQRTPGVGAGSKPAATVGNTTAATTAPTASAGGGSSRERKKSGSECTIL